MDVLTDPFVDPVGWKKLIFRADLTTTSRTGAWTCVFGLESLLPMGNLLNGNSASKHRKAPR